mgnify:CR=1 FL=1
MESTAVPPASEDLCATLQQKLQRWGQLGEAPEYYALRNRGPSRPTVVHDLNRFGGNMGPYTDAVLSLQSVEYINASAIDNLGPETPRFIATMCPKKATFAHFWSMVWELNSPVIINLTNEKDRVGSGPQDKRERYWPPFDSEGITKSTAGWPVQPHLRGVDLCAEVPTLQRFAIELHGPSQTPGGPRPSRMVSLYWYARWVDFPSSSSIGSRPFHTNAWHVLHLAMHIAEDLRRRGEQWAVCHCSAGVGRTGTFIALIHLLRKLPVLSKATIDDAVAQVIEAMRDRRLWMVKTDIEFATLYSALLLRLVRGAGSPTLAAAPPLPLQTHVPIGHAAAAACGHCTPPLHATELPSHRSSPQSLLPSCHSAIPPALPPQRNPIEADFRLTWELQEGDTSALATTHAQAAASSASSASGGAADSTSDGGSEGLVGAEGSPQGAGLTDGVMTDRKAREDVSGINNDADVSRYAGVGVGAAVGEG